MAENLGATFGELEESRRQIAAVVESMAEGVLAFDSEGLAHVVNPEAMRLLGVEPERALGVPVEQLTGDAGVTAAVHSALAGSPAVETVSLGEHVVLVHATPLQAPGGAIDGAVLLLSDVTDRHRMEAAQRRFVADASHELRTPIAALKGLLELLDDGAKDVPDVRDDFIHTMQLEADRLGRLVSDLLTLARLEAGNLEIDLVPVHVADVLDDVGHVMRALAEQAGVGLVVEQCDPELQVLADRDRIVQVLLSFTDNALKHSPEGGTVRLDASCLPGGVVRMSVADEGAGIPPDEVQRVFERFYRADSARGGLGTGLGLAIAKEIVEAHGSAIVVTSEPGAGTVFSFELPRD
jgi:PAS domain S-box-containing protein